MGKKIVTLSRKKWSRYGTSKGNRLPGYETGGSAINSLRCDDGKMCCLGFICRSLGFPAKDLTNEGDTPRLSGMDGMPDWYDCASGELIAINDDQKTDDAHKIKQINKILIKHEAPIRVKLED